MLVKAKPVNASFRWPTTLAAPSQVSTGPGMEARVKDVVLKLWKREVRFRVVVEPVEAGIPSTRMISPPRYWISKLR